jgi:hypothetical protein
MTSLEELLAIYNNSDNAKIRRKTFLLISEYLKRISIPDLTIIIERSKDISVIKEAKFQLWLKKLDKSPDVLLEIIRNCDDEDKVCAVIYELVDQGYKAVANQLINLLASANATLRNCASVALREIPTQMALKPLISAIRNHPDNCESLIYSLQTLDCSDATELLVDLFISNSNTPMVRIEIIDCFKEGAIRQIPKTIKYNCCLKIEKAIEQRANEDDIAQLKELYSKIIHTKES